MLCSRCHNATDSDGFCGVCGVGSTRPTLFGASRRGPGTFCPHCGRQNPPGWGYCHTCGSPNTAARLRHEWLAGLLALLLALIALACLSRALQPTEQPMPPFVISNAPQPIPVDVQTVVVSRTSDGVSQTEMVQTGDGAMCVSHFEVSVPAACPNSAAPGLNVRIVSSAPSDPNATTGTATYSTASAVN
ncbi:MAG TPA: zinc ribbon domain-containing protein [Armatimonadota bacterium]|nr:zinc ribbon domain-containing protein [Armatimonadota bacterium]